uniref:glycosyltransferase family 2 protein n=2 Tax=Rosenbergiella collisarenosi TaxID=1544695 RepID=UPI001F4E06AA
MITPLVSVYIVTCNRSDLLKRCLSSIQQQTYQELDIIVVDDASTDETKSFMEGVIKKDKRITYYRNEENKGACYSRNIAILNAKGKYITGSDDDDYFLNTRVESFVDRCDLLKKYSFMYSSNLFLNNNNLKKSLPNKFSKRTVGYNEIIDYNSVGNQIFIETKLLRKYLFDVEFPAWQDFECWYRILFYEGGRAFNILDYSYIQDVQHDKG